MSDLVKRLREAADMLLRGYKPDATDVGNMLIAADEIERLERELAAANERAEQRYRDGLLEAARICDKIALDYSFTPTENTTEDAAMECAAAIRAAAEQNTQGEPNCDVSAGTSHADRDGSASKPGKPSSQGGATQGAAPNLSAPVGGGVGERKGSMDRVPSGAEPVCPKCGAEELSNSVHGGFCQKCGRALDICICGREAK